MTVRTLAAAVALVLSVPSAHAGAVLEFKSSSTGGGPESRGTILLSPGAIRMETPEAVVIWRADKQVAWILDTKANTYHEVTRQGMAGMNEAMAEARAALANLPPEQRAMAEKMMAGRMPGGASPATQPLAPLSVTKTTATDTAAGLACTTYELRRGAEPAGRACVTAWSSLPITREDLQVLVDFGAFMREAMGSFAKEMPGFMSALESGSTGDALPGVPLKTWSADGRHLNEITRLAREDAPASKFQLPAGAKASSIR